MQDPKQVQRLQDIREQYDSQQKRFIENMNTAENNRIESQNKLDEMIVMEKYLIDDRSQAPMINNDTFSVKNQDAAGMYRG